MSTKIAVTSHKGGRRVLKSPIDFKDIDKNRKAMFAMDNWRIYIGYSDGKVDESGYFRIFGNIHCTALPFCRMLGWCYETVKRKTGKAR